MTDISAKNINFELKYGIYVRNQNFFIDFYLNVDIVAKCIEPQLWCHIFDSMAAYSDSNFGVGKIKKI